MRTLPILFKTEMVQALLDGRKSCTRRVIKLPDNMTGRPIGKSGDNGRSDRRRRLFIYATLLTSDRRKLLRYRWTVYKQN